MANAADGAVTYGVRKAPLILALVMPLMLTACGPEGPSKADTGMIVGAAAGGILGNQVGKGSGNVLATVAGAVVGGIVGSEIGRSMDEQDRYLAGQAELAALEEGESDRPRRWRNPDNGRYGDIVPSRPYKRQGVDCRDYTHTIYIDGRPRDMRGTACRNRDGTWSNVVG
ncbi:RT0821/Lpp0805 family surface protein [Hyphomicrobium sp. D-2]|uniref:RT0821/Lpp0805 family surface protein n=1 Tax=Hyphomicrobium sp. D-2 TaxID=3041621 RepID=UPI00245627E1|nr:RT0821/Lpp0805 family surface protein [Hyphomicrobium sp. D-2]MDH4981314.1 RT0821/Lpp0805 family surface protein [Hyphomicrobium sp. D-2]